MACACLPHICEYQICESLWQNQESLHLALARLRIHSHDGDLFAKIHITVTDKCVSSSRQHSNLYIQGLLPAVLTLFLFSNVEQIGVWWNYGVYYGPIFVCKLEMTGLLYAGCVGFCEAATGTNSQRAWLILSELLIKGVVIITCSLSESYRRAQCSNYTDERHQQLKNRGRKHLKWLLLFEWFMSCMPKKIILTTVIELSDASASLQPPS